MLDPALWDLGESYARCYVCIVSRELYIFGKVT